MKKATPGMVLLSACMLSACGQETTETNTQLPDSKASLPAGETIESGADVTKLKQELQKVRQKLEASSAALAEARDQIKIKDQHLGVFKREQSLFEADRSGLKSTTEHVVALEKQLGNQDMQLSQLRETLLTTEAGCKEVAEQLAQSMAN